MSNDSNKNILKTTNIVDEIKKKRDDIVHERRSFKREESIMKKRKEKINLTANSLDNFSVPSKNQLLSNLYKLKEELLSNKMSTKLEATVEIRKILSIEKAPPIQEVIDSGMLPIFTEFLKNSDEIQLQFEAAWILTNVASGTSEQTSKIVNCGAVPVFINLIEHEHENIKEQSVWALGNIAGDSCEYRDLVLQENILCPLLKQIYLTCRVSFLRNATWTLSNLCRGKPGPDIKYLDDILKGLAKLIFSEDTEILGDVCWALSYISDGSDERIQLIIQFGIIQRIVELLMHKDFHVQTPALRTIGNIVTGNDIQTQMAINCSVLPCLLILLNSSKKSIKKEACWAISNIAAGNSDQIQALIDCNLFPTLIYILKNAELDVKKEAAWAISNVTSGGKPKQVNYLIQQGCIKPMLDLLDSTDNRVIRVILEGLENILNVGRINNNNILANEYAKIIEQAGGVEKLETLQHHSNNEIYEKSLKILEKFFGAEDNFSDDSACTLDLEKDSLQNTQIPKCSFDFSEKFLA
nr:importin alpha [Cryptomonas sp.]